MMNRSKIEWCDFSWNPITGCRHGCSYCYARKQAGRFCGDIRMNKASEQLKQEGDLWILEQAFKNTNGKVIPLPVGFEPTLHKYRLDMPRQKKQSANIFVGSMADMFGEWVPNEWIRDVLAACEAAPWHNYLFLTKNPQRYNDLLGADILIPHSNYWFGGTRTGVDSDREHEAAILGNTFLSIEPLHGPIQIETLDAIEFWDWVIIGAETGNRKDKVAVKREWVESIVNACRIAEVPVFMKDSLKDIMGEQFVQEFPKGLEARPLPLPKYRVLIESVRDEKYCRHCKQALRGKAAVRMGGRYYLCPECLKEAEQ